MDKLEFIKKFYFGTYTEQERQYYIDNLMGEFEKQIGKPMFEFNSQDEVKYQVLEYNQRQGSLKRYDCHKCKNKGDIAVYSEGQFTLQGCECLQTRRTLKLIEDSGLGTLLDTCTFENYETKENWQANILEKAKQFVEEKNKWFYIQGNSGCGKTMICTAIVKELILKGKQARYMMWLDEAGELKQLKANNPQEYQSLVRELKNTEVLYIDDFLKVGKNETPTTADINLA
ncbi:MAG: ATP-binding protein, partial [Clostridia bacterium]|nr:ATP-binding protein [Clostridia bacterium]